MQLAFHIGARGTLFSKAICWKTGSPYSHVELVFDEWKSTLGTMCFSSDEKDGGTRFKWINLDPTAWKIVPLYNSFGQYKLAEAYASSKDGLKYDWLGILGFVAPFGEHDDNDRFCSEIVTEILQHAMGWPVGVAPWEVSPGELFNLYEKTYSH